MHSADASRSSGAGSEAEPLGLSASGSATLLQQVLDQRGKKPEPTHKEFGLSRWKEYAVLKHGNNARFQNSVHGREMIKLAALREYESEMSQMHQQVRSLQAHVQALEHELTVHKERVKEYEHTIERLSMQNDANHGPRKSSLTGRSSMDTRLLKSFLHGTAPHSQPKVTNARRRDSQDSETDASSITTALSPRKHSFGESRGARAGSTEDVLQGFADDLKTVTVERDHLSQQLKDDSAKYKRELQRLRLRCSIAESESITLKAKLQGLEPTDLDVLANPTLRKEVERVYESHDKVQEENMQLKALLSEALDAVPENNPVADKIRAMLNQFDVQDDSDSVA